MDLGHCFSVVQNPSQRKSQETLIFVQLLLVEMWRAVYSYLLKNVSLLGTSPTLTTYIYKKNKVY